MPSLRHISIGRSSQDENSRTSEFEQTRCNLNLVKAQFGCMRSFGE